MLPIVKRFYLMVVIFSVFGLSSGQDKLVTSECLGKNINLECTGDTMLRIASVKYGQSTCMSQGNCCPQNTECLMSSTVTENGKAYYQEIVDACSGKKQCQFTVKKDNALPCPGSTASDFVSVGYQCIPVIYSHSLCDVVSGGRWQGNGYLTTPGYPTPLSVPTSHCHCELLVLHGTLTVRAIDMDLLGQTPFGCEARQTLRAGIIDDHGVPQTTRYTCRKTHDLLISSGRNNINLTLDNTLDVAGGRLWIEYIVNTQTRPYVLVSCNAEKAKKDPGAVFNGTDGIQQTYVPNNADKSNKCNCTDPRHLHNRDEIPEYETRVAVAVLSVLGLTIVLVIVLIIFIKMYQAQQQKEKRAESIMTSRSRDSTGKHMSSTLSGSTARNVKTNKMNHKIENGEQTTSDVKLPQKKDSKKGAKAKKLSKKKLLKEKSLSEEVDPYQTVGGTTNKNPVMYAKPIKAQKSLSLEIYENEERDGKDNTGFDDEELYENVVVSTPQTETPELIMQPSLTESDEPNDNDADFVQESNLTEGDYNDGIIDDNKDDDYKNLAEVYQEDSSTESLNKNMDEVELESPMSEQSMNIEQTELETEQLVDKQTEQLVEDQLRKCRKPLPPKKPEKLRKITPPQDIVEADRYIYDDGNSNDHKKSNESIVI